MKCCDTSIESCGASLCRSVHRGRGREHDLPSHGLDKRRGQRVVSTAGPTEGECSAVQCSAVRHGEVK